MPHSEEARGLVETRDRKSTTTGAKEDRQCSPALDVLLVSSFSGSPISMYPS